nr:hypothetical protein [Butyrivibrio sp.]
KIWTAWIERMSDKRSDEFLNEHILTKHPVCFASFSDVKIYLYNSFAGMIPVIEIGNDDDFEQMIINAVYRGDWNENVKKQGAAFLHGKENRFIVLSKKTYSNVPSGKIGLTDNEWREKSMIIRREHECVHYYTRRFYGTARNNLHDELMADFFGLYEAFGEYRAGLFNLLMGLEDKENGRISLYTQDMPERVKEKIIESAYICSEKLEQWSNSDVFKNMTHVERLDHLCRLGINGILRMRDVDK